MKSSGAKIIKYAVLAITAVLVVTFLLKGKKDKTVSKPRDYAEIAQSGVLRAVTEYNAISYFAKGDSVTGFSYDLIHAFAKAHGLRVEITPEMSYEKRMRGLSDGTYDIIASDIPTMSSIKDSILLTVPFLLSRQILVQRKESVDSAAYIRGQLDLAKKTVHIAKGSPALMRIHNLGNEIADTIYTREVEKYSSEQLMAMVAHGDIDYAVSDETVAKAYLGSYPQLDINTGISFTLFYSWGVSKQSPALLDSLNSWLSGYKETNEYIMKQRRFYGVD